MPAGKEMRRDQDPGKRRRRLRHEEKPPSSEFTSTTSLDSEMKPNKPATSSKKNKVLQKNRLHDQVPVGVDGVQLQPSSSSSEIEMLANVLNSSANTSTTSAIETSTTPMYD